MGVIFARLAEPSNRIVKPLVFPSNPPMGFLASGTPPEAQPALPRSHGEADGSTMGPPWTVYKPPTGGRSKGLFCEQIEPLQDAVLHFARVARDSQSNCSGASMVSVPTR